MTLESIPLIERIVFGGTTTIGLVAMYLGIAWLWNTRIGRDERARSTLRESSPEYKTMKTLLAIKHSVPESFEYKNIQEWVPIRQEAMLTHYSTAQIDCRIDDPIVSASLHILFRAQRILPRFILGWSIAIDSWTCKRRLNQIYESRFGKGTGDYRCNRDITYALKDIVFGDYTRDRRTITFTEEIKPTFYMDFNKFVPELERLNRVIVENLLGGDIDELRNRYRDT